MAIIKSLYMRGAKQRLAGAVFYTMKGQTIARELASQVSNPRTGKQQAQRLRLANLVSLYRANQHWMKRGAFEHKESNWSDYNAFVHSNAGNSNSLVYLTKQQAAQGCAVVAPVYVTMGSLPAIGYEYVAGQQYFSTDLFLPLGTEVNGTTLVSELSTALLQSNNGLQNGDQISVIQNIQGTDNNTPSVVVRAYEFIINTNDGRTMNDLGLGGVLIADEITDEASALCVPFDTTGGVAVILSREVGGQIRVSSQGLELTSSAVQFLASFQSEEAFENASASYGETEDNFLGAGYMSNRTNSAVPVPLAILSAGVTSAESAQASVGSLGPSVTSGDTLDIVFNDNIENLDISNLSVSCTFVGNTMSNGAIEESNVRQAIQLEDALRSESNIIEGDIPESVTFAPTRLVGVTVLIGGRTFSATWQ